MSGCRQADDPSPQNRRLPRRIRETYGRKPELFTRMFKGTAVAARYPPVGPQGADDPTASRVEIVRCQQGFSIQDNGQISC